MACRSEGVARPATGAAGPHAPRVQTVPRLDARDVHGDRLGRALAALVQGLAAGKAAGCTSYLTASRWWPLLTSSSFERSS
jgi:hypothetical protein